MGTDLAIVLSDLQRLASALRRIEVPSAPDHVTLRRDRDQVIRNIEGYLAPRIGGADSPMLVVFAGPTGAGKSTMLNSVAAADLSASGPLRPTTTAPVVFAGVGWAGSYSGLGDVPCEVISGRAPILSEMTLVDTPDIDSTAREHRFAAEAMIDSADLVVFVSSAGRYSDAIPWEVLRRAISRGAPVIHVLNRVRPESEGAAFDYRRLLGAQGFGEDLIVIGEHHLPAGGQRVPPGAIKSLRRALVSHLEERREGRDGLLRSVLVATTDQARSVIDRATLLALSAGEARSAVETVLPGLDSILGTFDYDVGASLCVAGLSDQAPRSSWRLRRWLRRNQPGPGATNAVRASLVALLTGSVESDIRRRLVEVSTRIRGGPFDSTPVFSVASHEILAFAVERWALDLADLIEPKVPGCEDLAAALLIGALGARGDADRSALDVLTGNGDAAVSEARSRLLGALRPSYERAQSLLAGDLLAHLPSPAVIEEARGVLNKVVAEATFADA